MADISFPLRLHLQEEGVDFLEEHGQIVKQSREYVCVKCTGRSVYSNVYGVVYRPAQYFFGHISEVSDEWIEVDSGFFVPLRS